MARAQHPVQVAGPPASDDVDADVERRGDGPDRVEAERAEVAALEARHDALADAGPLGKVPLSPAPPDPQEPDGRTDALIRHEQRIAPTAYLPIAGRSPLR